LIEGSQYEALILKMPETDVLAREALLIESRNSYTAEREVALGKLGSTALFAVAFIGSVISLQMNLISESRGHV